jgi:hypothetical protein
LIADSEVDELSIFTGVNLYEMTLSGILTGTHSTLSFSSEPTGVAWNPANNHLFISQDTGGARVHEINPGPDGVHFTPDDVMTFFNAGAFGCADPEDLAFDTWRVLFIADGTGSKSSQFPQEPTGDLMACRLPETIR